MNTITQAQKTFLETKVIPYYLIYSKKQGVAYCQACDTNFDPKLLGKTKPGMTTTCPCCGEKVTLKTHKADRFWCWVEGTGIIPDRDEDNNFVLRYFSVQRIYDNHNKPNVKIEETKLRETVRETYYGDGTFTCEDRRWNQDDFKRCKLPWTDYQYSYYKHGMLGMHINPSNQFVAVYTYNIKRFFDEGLNKRIDINKFFAGFRSKCWYDFHEFVMEFHQEKFILFYEYMYKVGLMNLAKELQISWCGCTVDLKKKSLIDILNINKEKYKKLLALGEKATSKDLLRYQKEIKYNLKTEEDWEVFSKYIDNTYVNQIERFFEIYPSTLHKLKRYIEEKKSLSVPLYVSYMEYCKKLNLPLKNDFVLFPKDLTKAFDAVKKTYEELQFDLKLNGYAKEANKKANEYTKIVSIYSKKYAFEDNTMQIVVPATTREIGEEGIKLRHCVAQYMDYICKKEKVILFLRKKSEPTIPFFTVEIIGNMVTQCKGYRNCPRPDDVEKFLKAFAKDKRLKINKKEHFEAVM